MHNREEALIERGLDREGLDKSLTTLLIIAQIASILFSNKFTPEQTSSVTSFTSRKISFFIFSHKFSHF